MPIQLPALDVRPVQAPDILESYGKVLSLRDLMQRGQLQQQQLVASQQENQMRSQQIKDQQAMTQAMQEWDGKDFNSLPGLMMKHGASAQAVMSTKTGIIKQQQDLANLSKDQLANLKARTDAGEQSAQRVLSAKPGDQPAVYTVERNQLLSSGQFKPEEIPEQYPGEQFVRTHAMAANAARKQISEVEEAQSKAQTAASEATIKGVEAEAMKGGSLPSNLAEMKYQSILQKLAAKQPVSPIDISWARAYEASKAKSTTTSDSLGVSSVNTSRPMGLANVAPSPLGGPRTPSEAAPAPLGGPRTSSGIVPSPLGGTQPSLRQSLVDEIGQYKLNPQILGRMMYRHPEIIAQVAQKYPDWQQSNYNAINKAVTDLAPSGKTGQQITSYNTFLRHAGALYDAVDSLNNSKYSDLLNKPLNWLAQHTGDPRVADFMAAMQPPLKEFQSFLLNNHAMHEEDVKDAHGLIDQNKTPQEVRAVLKRFAETGSARLSEQNESFKRVTGRDIPNLVSPQAAQAYNKITGQGGGSGGHIIQIGDKRYQYNGSGDTANLSNYTEVK